MPIFPKLSSSLQEQLHSLITVMLIRALHDFTGGYDAGIPGYLAEHVVRYGFIGGDLSEPCSALDICRFMKINLFPHDRATHLIQRILKGTSRKRGARTLNTYMMTMCTSAEFLQCFWETGAYKRRKLLSKLKLLRNEFGSAGLFKCFSRSFQPQRKIRNTLLKMKRRQKTLAMYKYFKSLFKAPSTLRLKSSQRGLYRSKDKICEDIRNMHGLGVFGAKNFWQFFKPGITYPATLDRVYGEVRAWEG